MLEAMMAAIRQIENTASTTGKMELLKRYAGELPDFKDMLWWAYNPYKKFYIAHLPNSPTLMGDVSWSNVVTFLQGASTGKLRGVDLVGQFNEVAGRLTCDGRELFRRIVLKDLRCGIGSTLINKVFPGWVPRFGVMLATTLEEKHVPRLIQYGHYVYAQPKENGDRVVVVCPPEGETEVLSREGHQLFNYNRIASSFRLVTESSPYRGLVFDVEVIAGGDFFATRSVKKLAGNEAKDAVARCFDVIHYEQWQAGVTDQFRQRHMLACEIKNLANWGLSENLEMVPTWRLRPEQLTWEFMLKLRDWLIKKHGKEGLIVRPNVAYNFDTRASLFKLKKMDLMGCIIEEVLPGEEGKKHARHAGAVLVRLDDNETLCKAGLKLSDEERDEMWANRALYAGRACDVAYQSLTRNAAGIPKLQFPVYIGVRDDIL